MRRRSSPRGSGVAGAISRLGGPSIQEECHKLGPIKVGEAVITSGGNLKARFVNHAVAPRQGDGREDEKLARATFNSLRIAREKKLQSIAFPAISCGVYGYPIEAACRVALDTTAAFLGAHPSLRKVVFVLFSDVDLKVYQDYLSSLS